MQCWSSDYTRAYDLLEASGNGGEGTVYQVKGQPALVAKIYSPQSLERRYPDASGQYTWTMQEKVSYMASVAPSLPLRVNESGDEVLAIAWPQAPLFDANNQFVGFLMPRVAATSADGIVPDLHVAYRERERRYLFGDDYTWLTAIRLAKNLSTVVRELHEHGVVVGDFNCNNILIDRDAHVTLIDADSFCVRNELRDITYKCVVGVGEFIAPELQGVDLTTGHSRRTFTKESDCFSLAIHIFMLLMNGTHPFSGAKVGAQHQASSSAAPFVTEIASGACPYVTGSRLVPFGDTIRMSALPYEVRHAFDRTFGYANPDGRIAEEDIRQRPAAREWEQILERLYRECAPSLGRCTVDSTHVNPPDNETCMWCELDGRLTRLDREVRATSQKVVQNVPAGVITQNPKAEQISEPVGTQVASVLQGTPDTPSPALAQQSVAVDTEDSTQTQHEGTRGRIIAGVVIALVLFAIVSGSIVFSWGDSQARKGYYEGKTQEEIQADCDTQVEEGAMEISMKAEMQLYEGDTQVEARIENIAANPCDQKVKIYLADNPSDILYESGAIAPGEYIQTISLNHTLPIGQHRVTVEFQGYEQTLSLISDEGQFLGHDKFGKSCVAEATIEVLPR